MLAQEQTHGHMQQVAFKAQGDKNGNIMPGWNTEKSAVIWQEAGVKGWFNYLEKWQGICQHVLECVRNWGIWWQNSYKQSGQIQLQAYCIGMILLPIYLYQRFR